MSFVAALCHARVGLRSTRSLRVPGRCGRPSIIRGLGHGPDRDSDRGLLQALALHRVAKRFRLRGHLAAKINPLERDSAVPTADGAVTTTIPYHLWGHSLQEKIKYYAPALRNVLDMHKAPVGPVDLSAFGLPPEHALEPDTKVFVGSSSSLRRFVDPFERTTLRRVATSLQQAYCGSIGVEMEHIRSDEEQKWCMAQMEETALHSPRLSRGDQTVVLRDLIRTHVFENTLAKNFPAVKRFGLEGIDSVVPGLRALVERAASRNIDCLTFGMAHRGRLNVLNRIFDKPLLNIFKEVQEASVRTSRKWMALQDNKYHLGTRSDVRLRFPSELERSKKKTVELVMCANPSHLEMVSPVVVGMARAKQRYSRGQGAVMAVVLHGDAAFCGQGLVAETFQLSDLHSYTTGGVVHVVLNNQIGFTTDPSVARTSAHPTEVAKMSGAPIFHVNADDPEACVLAMRMAVDFREIFAKDAVVDIVGYRRMGHNELDDPRVTHPLLYDHIDKHPSVLELYARELVRFKVHTREEIDAMIEETKEEFSRVLEDSKRSAADPAQFIQTTTAMHNALLPSHSAAPELKASQAGVPVHSHTETGLDKEGLQMVARCLYDVTTQAELHKDVHNLFKQRLDAVCGPSADTRPGIDFAMAEGLALGSLVTEGWDIRFTGQDVERGTFAQRHAVVVCQRTGKRIMPINKRLHGKSSPLMKTGIWVTEALQERNQAAQHESSEVDSDSEPIEIPVPPGFFEIRNSPLMEAAVLGFEYGYSLELQSRNAGLVIWEAQFGDFGNMAQPFIDLFIGAGEERWLQPSRLTCLLPHGVEGQGPDHSSARVERFLQLAAVDDEDTRPGVLSPFEMQMIREGFKAVDADSDGYITAEELAQVMHMLMEQEPTESEVAEVLGFLDQNGDNRVSMEEWTRYMSGFVCENPEARQNLVVVMPTTPAQMFHVLRRQALISIAKPLVAFTPKRLLHHKPARVTPEQLSASARFYGVLVHTHHGQLPGPWLGHAMPPAAHKDVVDVAEVHTVLFCAGQVAWALRQHFNRCIKKGHDHARGVAVLSIEELAPFPYYSIAEALATFSSARHVAFVQEEPKNMGAWQHVRHRLSQLLDSEFHNRLLYIGRPPSASPASGSYAAHTQETNRIFDAVSEFAREAAGGVVTRQTAV